MKPARFVMLALTTIMLAALLWVCCTPVQSGASAITLQWTAPGDDDNVGTATSYDLRYSTVRPDTSSTATFDAWWAGAAHVTPMPTPSPAGTTQSVTWTPPQVGVTYYFVIRATDDAGNVSPYSNVAFRVVADIIPPARIIDLR